MRYPWAETEAAIAALRESEVEPDTAPVTYAPRPVAQPCPRL